LRTLFICRTFAAEIGNEITGIKFIKYLFSLVRWLVGDDQSPFYFATELRQQYNNFAVENERIGIMADKIKKSYKFSKSFYDDAITQGKWWSKLYFKLLWGGVDDNEIARRVLSWIPDDFKGKTLDVPVGTAVFTTEKYKRIKQADVTCLDYSQDMLEQAEYRFRGAGITNIKTMQGDVGALPFEEDTFDYVLCMNGLHVFPNKDKAYSEILRTLKSGGELLACFYIAGEQKVADWLAKTVMTCMGWFTPPLDTANDVRQRLEPYYDILDFHVEGAMLYFRAQKR
jgi:SAM-dependent methyltransferase